MHALAGAYLRFLHGIYHHLLFNIRLQSWLLALLAALALFSWTGRLAGGAGVALLWAGLALLLLVSQWWARRRFYVHFLPAPAAHSAQPPPPLWPEDKLLLAATGAFSVKDRSARLTNLPAYYRTFETREHAIMARCTPTRFLAAALDARLLSMWYLFLTPQALTAVQPGRLYFGLRPRPALRLAYIAADAKGRPKPAHAYLSFASESDRQQVYADLTLDLGGPAQAPWRADQGL
ncbi:MAG: hypothetical protein HUU23_14655 [Caldilineales bacterium]|nr:hypothetical protein [Caldilineales bacterium]